MHHNLRIASKAHWPITTPLSRVVTDDPGTRTEPELLYGTLNQDGGGGIRPCLGAADQTAAISRYVGMSVGLAR